MDGMLDALAGSLENSGPEWTLAIFVMVLAVAKVLPAWQAHAEARMDMARAKQDAEIAIERERERRNADDADRLARRDEERSLAEGRWLEQYERATAVQEQANAVMSGIEAQMATLNQTLRESREGSRRMAVQVDDIHHAVVDDRKE